MSNCYIFSKNKIDCVYVFLYSSEHKIYQFLSKKTQKMKNENSYFPQGGVWTHDLRIWRPTLYHWAKNPRLQNWLKSESTMIHVKFWKLSFQSTMMHVEILKTQFSQPDVINFQKKFLILNFWNIYYNFVFRNFAGALIFRKIFLVTQQFASAVWEKKVDSKPLLPVMPMVEISNLSVRFHFLVIAAPV